MGFEAAHWILNMFVAAVSVFVGILVLVMFVKALERKGRPALLLLPLGLLFIFWRSWQPFRHSWVYEISRDYELAEIFLIFVIFERLLFLICILLALLLIFKNDKPKMDELSDGLKTEEPSYGSKTEEPSYGSKTEEPSYGS